MNMCRSDDFEVLIVDDSSPDGTGDVARELIGIFGDQVVRR